jgi:cytochrome c oxidase subunit III
MSTVLEPPPTLAPNPAATAPHRPPVRSPRPAPAEDELEANPLGAPWRKSMMWIFIVGDGLIFFGILAAYGFLRLAAPSWPKLAEVFDIRFVALMTFVLITSSATMAAAVAAAKAGERRKTVALLAATVLGGATFLACQAVEWSHLIHEGARLGSNPWGPAIFGASFFAITGFHGTHVLSGLVVLLVTLARTGAGKTGAEGVELAGLYWHFVDLVWVFVFTLFYLF